MHAPADPALPCPAPNPAACRAEFETAWRILPGSARARGAASWPLEQAACGQSPSQSTLCVRVVLGGGGEDCLHGGWNADLVERPGELHRSVALERTLLEERLDHLFHEEGIAFGALDDEALERCNSHTPAL